MTFLLTSTELASISFEEAIAYAEKLLLNGYELSDLEFQQAIADLISTVNGARGFLVSYMTQDWEIGDRQMQAVIQAIGSVPVPAAELMVKNLSMSTAMAIVHRRAGNESQAQGSDRVTRRSTELIRSTNLDEVKRIAAQMRQSAQTGEGEYAGFLSKWGYDAEQKAAMASAISSAISTIE
jgi:transcription antitermination factor NusG